MIKIYKSSKRIKHNNNTTVKNRMKPIKDITVGILFIVWFFTMCCAISQSPGADLHHLIGFVDIYEINDNEYLIKAPMGIYMMAYIKQLRNAGYNITIVEYRDDCHMIVKTNKPISEGRHQVVVKVDY